MKYTNISTLTMVCIVATILLAAGIVTALSMAEEADARHKSKTTTKQTIIQRNINSGSSSNSNSGSNCIGGSCQTGNN